MLLFSFSYWRINKSLTYIHKLLRAWLFFLHARRVVKIILRDDETLGASHSCFGSYSRFPTHSYIIIIFIYKLNELKKKVQFQ